VRRRRLYMRDGLARRLVELDRGGGGGGRAVTV
jgi:hypothetical protein